MPREVAAAPEAGAAGVPPAVALDAAADVLDGLFDSAPVGLALVDRALRIARANAELARIAGIGIAQLCGRAAAEVLPDVARTLADALPAVLAGGPPVRDVDATGGEGADQRHLVVSCFPVAVAGAVVGAGLAIADVTPRRRRQELRTRLLAVATHDLKTPIFAILFTCQALLAGRLEGRQRRLVQGILSSARRVDGIVRDLVDYAVAERGGGIPIHRAAADMGAICRAVASECEAAHPGRKVDCEGTGDAEGEWDADRVAQAITNLVGNALHYGDPEAAVLLRWRSDAGEAVAEVHNRGAPIPEGLQPQLFDAFRRGPDERRGPGLGLGLYIAREIASAHGGRLELRSDAEGTVFTLTLPRRPP